MILSRNPKSMEPTITSEGKFMCTEDNQTFNTRAEYDKHCNQAHKENANKNW